MIHVELDFENLPLTVVMENDGEPVSILANGKDVEHLFTETACGVIYGTAWENHRDPNNEADFRRGELA